MLLASKVSSCAIPDQSAQISGSQPLVRGPVPVRIDFLPVGKTT